MRKVALVFAALLAISAAAAEDKVIYPRGAAPDGGVPAAGRPVGPSPVLLVVALGAAAAGGWLLWRQRRSLAGPAGKEVRRLNITESRTLGNRQYLVVADYDGRKFLLGVCPGRIDMLAPLDGGPLPAKSP